jgi:hypothetical protein
LVCTFIYSRNIFEFNHLILTGLNGKYELSIMPELFLSEPKVKKWKIEFNVFTSVYGETGFGKSSIILGLNERPKGGTCSISPLTGIADSTLFTIECVNFTDVDGYITKFEYFCKYLNAYSIKFINNLKTSFKCEKKMIQLI